MPWGVRYADAKSSAPLHVPLHPTQLYSSATLFLIFLLLYFVLQRYLRRPGQLVSAYLVLMSIERFAVDFWRGDRALSPIFPSVISFDQLLAIGIFCAGLVLFCWATFRRTNETTY